MNAMEQLLSNELHRLVDRIATTGREGLVIDCEERRPDLFAQLADAETRLSTARQSLLRDYAGWQGALEECEELWALAALATEPPVAGSRRAA